MSSNPSVEDAAAFSIEFLLQLFGANFIGLPLAVVILGISSVQTYLYFQRFRDNRLTQVLVLTLFTGQCASVLSQTQCIYTGLITHFGDIITFIELLQTRTTVYFSIGIVQSGIVQVFFLVRIWILSKSVWKTAIVVIPVMAQIGFGLSLVTEWIKAGVEASVLQGRLLTLITGWIACEIVSDSTIAIMLCTLLLIRKAKSDITATNTLLNQLALYTVSTGAITIAFSAVIAVGVIRKNPLILGVIGQPYAGIFPLAMLANLHSRSRIRLWDKKSSLRAVNKHETIEMKAPSRPTDFSGRSIGTSRPTFSFFGRSTQQTSDRGVVIDITHTKYSIPDATHFTIIEPSNQYDPQPYPVLPVSSVGSSSALHAVGNRDSVVTPTSPIDIPDFPDLPIRHHSEKSLSLKHPGEHYL